MRLANLAVLWLACALPVSAFADSGRFVVLPPVLETDDLREEAREMQESGALQDLAQALNSVFVLPVDVGMRYAECGQPNAFYDPNEHEIQICLELLAGMAETLEGQFETEEDTANALAGAYLAVVLHEAGHALVDVLELPVTGREEDAVDQLSAWVLIEAEDVGSVLGAAATYYTETEVADDDFADEHSLDRQRYFNLVCWAYGSDPENQGELIEVWGLTEARAGRCEEEYAQLDRSWTNLLSAHLREDGEEVADEEPVADAPTAPSTRNTAVVLPGVAPRPGTAGRNTATGTFVGTGNPKPDDGKKGGQFREQDD